MTKYEFTLILKGVGELTEEMADALFEAGCDDGTPGTCNGVFSIDFHRESESLESALRSAIAHVKLAGYEVERVEINADTMVQTRVTPTHLETLFGGLSFVTGHGI